MMELNDFVSQTLVQIVKGVEQANEELAKGKPPSPGGKPFLLYSSVGQAPHSPHVEFDIAVTTKTDNKAKGGALAKLYVVGFEASGTKSTFNENVSHVRFSVMVKEHQG